MPATYDVYTDQLRELQKGQALHRPEPSPETGPVEIGDVGYIRQGSFHRMFNITRSAGDPSQLYNVPDGFRPLDLGRIRVSNLSLRPGPLHGRSIVRDDGLGSLDGSLGFSCAPGRGAILMLETLVRQEQVLPDARIRQYVLENCHSWYVFARELGVGIEFGDIMLVTECFKTASWASSVYTQSSMKFRMSFSPGGNFFRSVWGDGPGDEDAIGPVTYRRTRWPEGLQETPKDQTIFIKGYHLGTRQWYTQSLAHRIQKRNLHLRRRQQDRKRHWEISTLRKTASAANLHRHLQPYYGPPDSVGRMGSHPDFQPAVALLAHLMESTDSEIAVVHDDEWCLTYSYEVATIIEEFSECFLNSDGIGTEETKFHISFPTPPLPFIGKKETAQTSDTLEKAALINLLKDEEEKLRKDIIISSFGKPHTKSNSLPEGISLHKSLTRCPSSPALSQARRRAVSTSGKKPNVIKSYFLRTIQFADSCKIVLMGDSGVGKTALARKFMEILPKNARSRDKIVENSYRRVLPVDNRICAIEVIDTSGKDGSEHLIHNYFSERQAFALVYSVNSRASFDRIEDFRRAILRYCHCKIYILVANNINDGSKREVSEEEGQQLAEMFDCDYIETTPRTGKNIDQLASDLVRILRGTRPMLTSPQLPVTRY